MKAVFVIFFGLFLAYTSSGQKQSTEIVALEKAFKQKSTPLLSIFIDDWKANTSVQETYRNDTIKWIHDIIRDMMIDTTRNSWDIFSDLADTGKYHIFQSTIKYGVVKVLNPDSIILQAILSSRNTDKSKILSLYDKLDTKSRAKIWLMGLYYIPLMPDSMLDSISDFRPDLVNKYLYPDKKYISQLSDFLGKGLGTGEKWIDFVNRKIALKYIKPLATHRYIVQILIDASREWAYIYYMDSESGSHVLLHKENQKWHLFGLISSWIY